MNRRERDLLGRVYLVSDKIQGLAVPPNPADLERWVRNGKRTKAVGSWLTVALALILQGDLDMAAEYVTYAEREWGGLPLEDESESGGGRDA